MEPAGTSHWFRCFVKLRGGADVADTGFWEGNDIAIPC